MVHPYIKALTEKPYNYKINQPDKKDEEKYTYDCGEGILLDIHIRKASMFWPGIGKDGAKIARKDFPTIAKNAANAIGKDFNVVKMDIGVPDTKYAVGDAEPEPEEEFVLKAPEKPQVEHKTTSKPITKQTQLVTTEKAVVSTGATRKTGFFFTERQIEAMKHTVAKGASQAEFEMFIYLATKYKLDPFLKEIFFIPGNMKTMLTSRDGYLKIAQNHKDFEGIRSMAVRSNDDFEIDLENDTIKHKFGKGERGPIIGAWAIVYRKNRRPVISFADISEYMGSTGPWKKYPSAMICKCAEAFALKRQFAINGLVTQEEMDVEAPEIVDPEFVMRVDDDEADYIDAEYEVMQE